MKLINKLFKLEEINGKNRCPTYLFRWTLLRLKWFSVYLHHFVGDDWSRDLHDHPKRFISLGLWGWYLEETPIAGPELIVGELPEFHPTKIKRYQAPWIRTFPATHVHRITVPSKNCWTLVIVLTPVREWGFWHEGRFMPWRRYVEGEDGIADKMKACSD